MREIGRRTKTQPAPPWAVWESLSNPVVDSRTRREWLTLLDDEVPPEVLESRRSELVVWSSLWRERSDIEIRFEIADDGGQGSLLTWVMAAPGQELDLGQVSHFRYRVQTLINAELRYSFGQ
jgi:hypothetical protein